MYNNKNNTKKNNISKKNEIPVGAWPTRPPLSFSRIFGIVLTLQNP